MTKTDKPMNDALWLTLEKTDPKYTKPYKGKGGFSGTAINGTYLLKRLTETFGPCGKGWKFVLDDERVEQGHTLKNGDKARLHIVRGHIEYKQDGDADWSSTSPQFGQTMLVDENKYGTFTDEEAPKKSITDCISKCAVLLGLAGDVYLGLFDDNKYVNQRKAEEASAAPEASKADAPPPPSAEPGQAPAGDSKPTEEQVHFVRSVYASVKMMVANAKTLDDINDCLKANKAGLDELRRVSPANADGLVKIVKARMAELKTAPDFDDPLPEH